MLTKSAEKSASLNEPPMRAKTSCPKVVAWSFQRSPCQPSQPFSTRLSTSSARSSIVSGGEKNPSTKYLIRSEEHTSELQSLMRISYAVFCLKKKNNTPKTTSTKTLDPDNQQE